MAKIIVSGCLLGIQCRYKGDGKMNEKILALAQKHTLICVCPEQMGGLATPRPPAEQKDGRVLTQDGSDVTEQYQKGAEAVLRMAQLNHADFAILKARSPSCGSGIVYDGTFTGTRVSGDGVCAALLKKNGIPVYTEEELDKLPVEV